MIANLKTVKAIILALTLTSFCTVAEADNSTCSSDECGNVIEGFERYANRGHVESMVLLAVAYANGEGVEQNDEKANFWIKEALRNRSAMAAYVKATWRREGKVVEQDLERAEMFIDRAIDGGLPIAMYDRAVNLMRDNRDIPEALELLEEANERDLPEAAYLLARLIEEGQFYEQDIVTAGLIYRDLALVPYKDARSRLNRIVREIEAAEEAPVPEVEEVAQTKDEVLSQLREYDNMEVITVTGQYESFEDQLASIQQNLRSNVFRNTGTRMRRMRPCGPQSGSACQVIFDRNSAAESPFGSIAELLGQ
ncbi:MAG: Sel1 repeat domain protein [Idiomarinaceae bacterium HL-53]|nr:MAG: Sel1 repeat domain protein [Idiomarinaceae bacterium HL-53]CUS47920.1 Sel1 repeat-containing protein [Idiomarinaceae bacterium HL-53]